MSSKGHDTVAAIATLHAAQAGGASQAASAVIECVCGAATPLISSLFTGGTMQERLLFTLVLTGACATVYEDGNSEQGQYGMTINVCPKTLNEAFRKFTLLTGSDIRKYLPQPMLDFAAQEKYSHLN